YCCVKWCGKNTNTSSVKKDGISFHRFPKCPNLKEMWIDATKRSPDWFPSHTSVLCSRHFKPEYIKLTSNNRRFLYTNAIHYIFVCFLVM
ncbi:THAP domain-containing protein 3-like, partial [Cydia pomonella]|uniref:THAP domain-containing protein 3-like n=1 Tax=Cydia pomonella TaxID=82600 RepID=UPI002ADDEAA4